MIPFASQRGGGQDLATHLMNAYDNEVMELAHIRGAVARDLHGAFKEWEVQADALTRCEKYLYSLSINPDPRQGEWTRDQYMDYIARAEDMLGLKGQPRAIVFHTKYGREHCHVIWSRIDVEQQRAVHLAFDHDKLMRVTRGFARDHGLELPKGYDKSRQVGQESLYERAQKLETGLSKADHMRLVTEAWQHSDNARSFVRALADRGYILATGKRPYVLVDLYGGNHALPRLIDDKLVRTTHIRAFLEKDYPVHSLPTVEQAEELVAAHRKLIERSVSEDRYASALAALQHSQRERRAGLDVEREGLKTRHHHARLTQQQEHRLQRHEMRAAFLKTVRDVRQARNRHHPTGLAAFLGRVTGIERVRKALHRRQDAKRLNVFSEQFAELKGRQGREVRTLEVRLKVQAEDVARRAVALEKVERRELAAFLRDQRAAQRARARGEGDAMPSLAAIHRPAIEKEPRPDIDVLKAFARVREHKHEQPPDLQAAFGRAAKDIRRSERDRSEGAPENDRGPIGPARGR